MELKAVTAKYEDASQLAKYKDALVQRGERNLLMWLVAPHIPNSVREFLDRIGIEYSEIHEAQFRRVAERHDVKLQTEEIPTPKVKASKNQARSFSELRRVRGPRAECPYKLNAEFDKNRLDELLRAFTTVVRRQVDRSVADKLRRELLDSTPPSISGKTMERVFTFTFHI